MSLVTSIKSVLSIEGSPFLVFLVAKNVYYCDPHFTYECDASDLGFDYNNLGGRRSRLSNSSVHVGL